MSDKPFDPVTEGTPKDFIVAWPDRPSDMPEFVWHSKIAALIAARDAAMLKKGEEKGRLKGYRAGVTDAGRIANIVCPCKKVREAIRAAAETAKESNNV